MNKLACEYNNICNSSIRKRPIHADYSALNEEFETNLKSLKFKVGERVKITNYKNTFRNVFAEKKVKM